MQLISFAEAEPYGPPSHDGVVNRLLTGRRAGDVAEVSIWHGVFERDGDSEAHVHEQSVQIYVGLGGVFEVTGAQERYELRPNDALIIAAGESHAIRNIADGESIVLVISSPALR